MNICILIPTGSEARRVIAALDMKRVSASAFVCNALGVHVTLRICGMGADNARKTAETVLNEGVDFLVLAGFCGGLREGVNLGDVVVDNQYSTPDFIERIVRIAKARCIPAHAGAIQTSNMLLADPEAKARLGVQTGALAVDMEGAGVLGICRDRKRPFLSFRTVSDDVNQQLPDSIHRAALQGKATLRFWLTLLFVPWEWPAILRELIWARKAAMNLATLVSDWVGSMSDTLVTKDCDSGPARELP